MNPLITFNIDSWSQTFTHEQSQQAINALETGNIVYLPNLAFPLLSNEQIFLSSECGNNKRKNISYDIKKNSLQGTKAGNNKDLQQMLQRYAQTSQQFINNLLSSYHQHLIMARTSYRPAQIAGRKSSYRKDDTRLHVDAFPASPVNNNRILRIFSNVNPHGEDRVWRVGDQFSNVVDHFAAQLPRYNPYIAKLLQLIKITRGYRKAYDHYMLKLHNLMKFDVTYQKDVRQIEAHFPPGCTWVVYTDIVSHAAMSGQFAFEQSFYLPLQAMDNPELAPQRIMEKRFS